MSAVYGTVPNPIWAWDTGKISDNAFFSGNCGFPFEFRSAHLANSTEYIFLKLGLSSISYSVVWIDINYLLLCNSKLSTSEEHVFIISHIFWLSTIWERLSWVILARFLLRLLSSGSRVISRLKWSWTVTSKITHLVVDRLPSSLVIGQISPWHMGPSIALLSGLISWHLASHRNSDSRWKEKWPGKWNSTQKTCI